MARRILATCNWPASSPSNFNLSTGRGGLSLPRLFLCGALSGGPERDNGKWKGCERVRRAIQLGTIVVLAAAMHGQGAAPPDGLREKALLLERQGQDVEAEEAWRADLKVHPSNPEPYAHLGLLEARQAHYEEAAADYREALAIGPSIPALHLNLGLALFKGGDLKGAIQELEPLLKQTPESSPDNLRLTILVGMAHYGLAEYSKAAPYLKSASERDPNNLSLLLALAHSYLWSEQFNYVMDVYHRILALNAESAEADMLAGEALDEMKDSDGAIKMFRAAATANPKEPDVHFGLGYLLWMRKQYPEALVEFQAELELNPNHAQALTYLGDCDLVLTQPVLAQPLLEKAIQVDPGIELAHLDLGVIDADAGRQDDALRELATAEKLAPNDVNAHWRLGRLYRSQGKMDLAKAEFDKAKSITQTADTDLVNQLNSKGGKTSPTGTK
jgi:tetratricopeptide (TPR) repeat protein